MSVLIWVLTVCKGYQQMTKVAASKETVKVEKLKVKWTQNEILVIIVKVSSASEAESAFRAITTDTHKYTN